MRLDRKAATTRGWLRNLSASFVVDFLSSAEGLQLNRAFARISNPKVRRKVIELAKVLADDEEQ